MRRAETDPGGDLGGARLDNSTWLPVRRALSPRGVQAMSMGRITIAACVLATLGLSACSGSGSGTSSTAATGQRALHGSKIVVYENTRRGCDLRGEPRREWSAEDPRGLFSNDFA
jgi:hypothetical protein